MPGGYRGRHVSRSGRRLLPWAAGAAAVLALIAAAVFSINAREPAQGAGSHGEVPPPPSSSDTGSASSDVSQPLPPPQPPDVSVEPPESSVPKDIPYDFSQPVPEREAVDNSYFDDAAFVGDSRTDGFMLYSGIGTGKNLTSNGLSIFRLAEKKALKIGGKQYTLLEALALEQYGKVYLSLGVNELGINNDKGFYNSYCAAIDEIRKVQPNAVIYIQGLIPVNEKQLEEYNGNKYRLTNEHLRVYNDLMRQAAEEKQAVYLDLYSEFADEEGILPEGLSRDGVHLVKDACKQWLEYLKTHTVEFDELYPEGPPTEGEPDSLPAETEPDVSTEDGSVQG